jgi:hypothetical protein
MLSAAEGGMFDRFVRYSWVFKIYRRGRVELLIALSRKKRSPPLQPSTGMMTAGSPWKSPLQPTRCEVVPLG